MNIETKRMIEINNDMQKLSEESVNVEDAIKYILDHYSDNEEIAYASVCWSSFDLLGTG